MRLLYYEPKRSFSYLPDGNPFLIKRGHSLSKISDIVYENWERWPEIRNNNSDLIKNPNKIYAGFTLYYIPDEFKDDSSLTATKDSLEILVEEKSGQDAKQIIQSKILKKPKPKKEDESFRKNEKKISRFRKETRQTEFE